MSLQIINNGEFGGPVRSKINAGLAQTDTNTTNIAANTSEIADNTADIATNTAAIATNTANIATNTSNIATNTANIATNTANIATNTADILLKQDATSVSTLLDRLESKTNDFDFAVNNTVYLVTNSGLVRATIRAQADFNFLGGTNLFVTSLGSGTTKLIPAVGVTVLYNAGLTDTLSIGETACIKKIGGDLWVRVY